MACHPRPIQLRWTCQGKHSTGIGLQTHRLHQGLSPVWPVTLYQSGFGGPSRGDTPLTWVFSLTGFTRDWPQYGLSPSTNPALVDLPGVTLHWHRSLHTQDSPGTGLNRSGMGGLLGVNRPPNPGRRRSWSTQGLPPWPVDLPRVENENFSLTVSYRLYRVLRAEVQPGLHLMVETVKS